VLVKIIPKEIQFDSVEKRIVRSKESIINLSDLVSIGAANAIKKKTDCEVIAISMGPESVVSTYEKVFYFGVERAILFTDKLFANSDVFATANILSTGIRK